MRYASLALRTLSRLDLKRKTFHNDVIMTYFVMKYVIKTHLVQFKCSFILFFSLFNQWTVLRVISLYPVISHCLT